MSEAMSSSGRRLKSFASSPMILLLRSRWKCLRISPRVLGSETTTWCSMVPSRLSLFRNAAVREVVLDEPPFGETVHLNQS